MTITRRTAVYAALGAAGILSILLFWYGWYLPTRARIARLSAELETVQTAVRRLDGVLNAYLSPREGFAALEEELAFLDKKFPDNTEDPLQTIADLAEACGMDIISVKPHPRMPVEDRAHQPVVIEGKTCYQVGVSLSVSGPYGRIGEFLDALQVRCPYIVTIGDISLRKSVLIGMTDGTVGLTIYLLL